MENDRKCISFRRCVSSIRSKVELHSNALSEFGDRIYNNEKL